MNPMLHSLWKWLTRGEAGTITSFVLLIAGILLGSVATLAMIGLGLTAGNAGQALRVIVWISGGGSLVWGFIAGVIQPRQAVLWSTGFAAPAFAWGLFCLPFAFVEDIGLVLWLAASLAMAALCILGVLLARRLRRWLAEGGP